MSVGLWLGWLYNRVGGKLMFSESKCAILCVPCTHYARDYPNLNIFITKHRTQYLDTINPHQLTHGREFPGAQWVSRGGAIRGQG